MYQVSEGKYSKCAHSFTVFIRPLVDRVRFDIVYGLNGIQVSFAPNFSLLTRLLKILDIVGGGGMERGGCPISFMVLGAAEVLFIPNV